jgi:hypothetical protein
MKDEWYEYVNPSLKSNIRAAVETDTSRSKYSFGLGW